MIEKLKMSEIDEILELNKGLSIKTWPKSSFEHDLSNDIALINVLKIDDQIFRLVDTVSDLSVCEPCQRFKL